MQCHFLADLVANRVASALMRLRHTAKPDRVNSLLARRCTRIVAPRSFQGDVNGNSCSLAYPCPFRRCSSFGGNTFGDVCVSCRRASGVAGARQSIPQRVDDDVEHCQVRDRCGERTGQRVARQEDHRRSHVSDLRARKSLSEGHAAARIWRAHSFHHLQADRPRTTLSHRSRRALRDQGRQFLLRLDDGVWRHLPHVPGCRARQDVAEAVGLQGGEGECRRSDGVDVAEGRFRSIPRHRGSSGRARRASKRRPMSR